MGAAQLNDSIEGHYQFLTSLSNSLFTASNKTHKITRYFKKTNSLLNSKCAGYILKPLTVFY